MLSFGPIIELALRENFDGSFVIKTVVDTSTVAEFSQSGGSGWKFFGVPPPPPLQLPYDDLPLLSPYNNTNSGVQEREIVPVRSLARLR